VKQEIFSLHFNVPPLYCLVVNGGIRSFLTGFDGEKFIDIGNWDVTRIFRLGWHIDKLIRVKTTLKGRKNKYKRHQISQIDEVHRKVAKWLTTEPERYFYSYF